MCKDDRGLVCPCFSAQKLYQGAIVLEDGLIGQHADDPFIFDSTEDRFCSGLGVDDLVAVAYSHFFDN